METEKQKEKEKYKRKTTKTFIWNYGPLKMPDSQSELHSAVQSFRHAFRVEVLVRSLLIWKSSRNRLETVAQCDNWFYRIAGRAKKIIETARS
ncbi:MAG: hypothetical protein CR997_00370 [Acidobacteria bacterium]|nr:MAG: hypothetical protein CR997_00370 [Acidobacteriota bacterium]